MSGPVDGERVWRRFNLPEFRGLSRLDLAWVEVMRTARHLGDVLNVDGMTMEEAGLCEAMERVLYAPGDTYIRARNWEFLGMIDRLSFMLREANDKVRCLFI